MFSLCALLSTSFFIKGVFGDPGLTQQKTDGLSLWGTLQAPELPPFLTNNPLPAGFPWGSLTAEGSNPNDVPNTGVVRSYHFTLKRGIIAPDGYQKNGILINGQFPGPMLEANWGDTIQVTLHNQITGPEEGTSLHWHGLIQKETPWFDGVPAVQQCPIAPGASFTYTFKADTYGTSWYHSHYSSQFADGAFGPMIVYGPSNARYDVDLGPVIITDWYHMGYFAVLDILFAPLNQGGDPGVRSDNNLINGRMDFNCSTVAPGDKTKCTKNARISKFRFNSGKTYKLRLINAGAEALQRFSIDGHNMTIIANDFVPVKPYTTNIVTLGVGQRTDVLVTANQGHKESAFWMRSNISIICSTTNQPNALAAIYYDKADTTINPTSTGWDIPDPNTCQNDDLALTIPLYPMKPTPEPATTRNFTITFEFNATGSFLYLIDNQTFRADFNAPVLLLANQGNLTYPPEWAVKDFGSNSTIRIVLYNPSRAPHPMHLHGHTMSVLHQGPGEWDGVSITNPDNPQRRDVQMIAVGGHIVLQFEADNPGVWPFHCHIAWHISGGLYVNILERPADIQKDVQVPLIMAQTCRDWAAYTNTHLVDQIDSGL